MSELHKKIYVRVTCAAVDTSRKDYEASLDAIAEALFGLPDGAGAEFTALSPEMQIRFGFVIQSEDFTDAAARAISIARTALHTAGQNTPRWNSEFEVIESSQRQLEIV